INMRGAVPTPGTATQFENCRCILDAFALLLWSQFRHSPVLIGVAERRKNLSGDTEIGMIHVRPLDCRRNFQCQFSELVGSHLTRGLCLFMHRSYRASGCYGLSSQIPATAALLHQIVRCMVWVRRWWRGSSGRDNRAGSLQRTVRRVRGKSLGERNAGNLEYAIPDGGE